MDIISVCSNRTSWFLFYLCHLLYLASNPGECHWKGGQGFIWRSGNKSRVLVSSNLPRICYLLQTCPFQWHIEFSLTKYETGVWQESAFRNSKNLTNWNIFFFGSRSKAAKLQPINPASIACWSFLKRFRSMNRRYMSYHKQEYIFPQGGYQPIWWIHVHYRSLLLPQRKEN